MTSDLDFYIGADQASLDEIIQPGTYVLTRDVANPNADRRCTRDWTRTPTLEKGTVFYVTLESLYDNSADFFAMRRRGSYFTSRISEHSNPELFHALVPALERLDETVSDYLSRIGEGDAALRILDRLVESGRCSLADVKAALEVIAQ